MSTGLKRAIVTAAILAGSAILSSKVQAQGPKSYPENSTNKTIHASTPTNLESRINFYNFGLIALDPGHDTVCNRPPVNGIYEKDLNLIVANMTSSLLRDKGHDVISTRKDGYGVNKDNIDVNNDKEVNLKDELDARSIFMKSKNPDLVISVHHNARKNNTTYNGLEIHAFGVRYAKELNNKKPNYHLPENCNIYSDSSMYIAKKLAQYFTDRGIAAKAVGSDMRILSNKPAPITLIVELGYLTNPSDFKRATSKEWQEIYARTIADFIDENSLYICGPKFYASLIDIKKITSENVQELSSRLLADFIKEKNGYMFDAKPNTQNYLSDFKTAVFQKEKERRSGLLAHFIRENRSDKYHSKSSLLDLDSKYR